MVRLYGLVVVAIAAVLAGCSPAPEPVATSPDFASTAFRRSFGPDFPPLPPLPPGARIDGAVLSRDRTSVSISFIGGQAYDRANPCSEDYGAWAGAAGDTLELEILAVEHPDQVLLGPNVGCTAEGYSYLFRILFPAPFLGTNVKDRPTGPIWVAPPEQVAEPPIPPGWMLTAVHSSEGTHQVGRDYGPGPGAPGDADRYLALYQVFDGPPAHDLDAPVARASIRGQDVPVGRNGDTGFMVT